MSIVECTFKPTAPRFYCIIEERCYLILKKNSKGLTLLHRSQRTSKLNLLLHLLNKQL